MALARVSILVAVMLAAATPATPATPAAGRSVRDPDIGWSETLRRELRLERPATRPCTGDLTAAMRTVPNRVDDHLPFEALRATFHYRWGNAWYDRCDGGLLKVGVPPAPAADVRRTVRRARTLIARRRLTRDVAFVAVRSTYRDLSDAQDALYAQFGDLYARGLLSSGIETDRNTIVYDVARPVTPADYQRLAAAALQSPANVVLHRVDSDDLGVTSLR